MDQDVTVVEHQYPCPQVIETKLPLAIVEGIGYHLRHSFVLQPSGTGGRFI